MPFDPNGMRPTPAVRAVSRLTRLAIVVGTAVCLLVGEALAIDTTASASLPGGGGDTTCGSATPPPSRFYLTAYYGNGGVSRCAFGSSQYSWMVAARDADVRGIEHLSGATKIDVRDAGTGAEVVIEFCGGDSKCVQSATLVHAGSGTWTVGDGNCFLASIGHRDAVEGLSMRTFLYDIGQVVNKKVDGTSLIAPKAANGKADTVTYGTCIAGG